jgi:hypothetical protein
VVAVLQGHPPGCVSAVRFVVLLDMVLKCVDPLRGCESLARVNAWPGSSWNILLVKRLRGISCIH